MMSEAEIQRRLEEAIASGTLCQHIAGRDAIDRANSAGLSRSFIPDFNLDYLMRRLSIRSAARVLAALDQVDLISTARRNISADRTERLFPDLVLVSRATGHVLVVEIKRDDQTTREAMTELFAYEQEIRNQLPYLPGDQIMFVLVASSFPTLLSHAVGQAILWQRKQVLALQVVDRGESLLLRVVLPVGWSATRLSHVPARCFQTADLIVTPSKGQEADGAEGLILDVTHLIAREGERLGAHGFVLVSAESTPEGGGHRDICTVGVISATAMLQEMVARADQPPHVTEIMEYASKYMSMPTSTYDLIAQLTQTAIEILTKRGRCDVRYREDLAVRRGDTSADSVFYRYNPYAMLFWGLPHTYRDTLVHHEALLEMFPFLKRRPNPQDATIGIFVLDYLTRNLEFQDGEFGYQQLWRFGRMLGRCRTILAAYSTAGGSQSDDSAASLRWLGHDLLAAMCEVAFRVRGARGLPDPPPLKWGQHTADMLRDLDVWVSWFRGSFLANHEDHRRSFDEGLALHPLFDEKLGASLLPKERAMMTARAGEAVTRAHGFALGALADNVLEERHKRRIRQILQEAKLPTTEPSDAQTSAELEGWIKALPSLLAVYDEVLPSVVHELEPIDPSGIDWGWVRQEVEAAREGGGKAIGILVQPGGQVEICDFGEISQPLPLIRDFATEILLAIEHSGHILSVMRTTWDELINGSALRRVS